MPRRYPSHLKFLVVDANPLLQRALKDMLGMWGVGQAVSAANGQEAKELLRRDPYDLLVTDWMMEPVSGAQLVSWVRQSPGSLRPDLPIIVLTANADVATVRAAWDAGADSVLAKPVPAATIARRIETVLSRPRRSPSRPARNGPDGAPVQTPHDATRPPTPKPHPTLPADRSPLRLPPPSAPLRAANPKRVRLMLAIDRLEAALENPDGIGARLRHAVSDLQLVAAGDHGAAAIAASLSTCITWVEPDTEGYAEAVQAHASALRWMAACDGGADTLIAVRALLRSLRAAVRTLALRGAADTTLWPDVPQPPAGQDGFPLPPV